MLQRLTEDLEYHDLLDKAVHCASSVEQMCLVAAFSVSSYSTTVHRIAKPFNPMLGETFELDRLEDMGLRSLCEQVRPEQPEELSSGVWSGHTEEQAPRRRGAPWAVGRNVRETQVWVGCKRKGGTPLPVPVLRGPPGWSGEWKAGGGHTHALGRSWTRFAGETGRKFHELGVARHGEDQIIPLRKQPEALRKGQTRGPPGLGRRGGEQCSCKGSTGCFWAGGHGGCWGGETAGEEVGVAGTLTWRRCGARGQFRMSWDREPDRPREGRGSPGSPYPRTESSGVLHWRNRPGDAGRGAVSGVEGMGALGGLCGVGPWVRR